MAHPRPQCFSTTSARGFFCLATDLSFIFSVYLRTCVRAKQNHFRSTGFWRSFSFTWFLTRLSFSIVLIACFHARAENVLTMRRLTCTHRLEKRFWLFMSRLAKHWPRERSQFSSTLSFDFISVDSCLAMNLWIFIHPHDFWKVAESWVLHGRKTWKFVIVKLDK